VQARKNFGFPKVIYVELNIILNTQNKKITWITQNVLQLWRCIPQDQDFVRNYKCNRMIAFLFKERSFVKPVFKMG
jgi:hypothetical protein